MPTSDTGMIKKTFCFHVIVYQCVVLGPVCTILILYRMVYIGRFFKFILYKVRFFYFVDFGAFVPNVLFIIVL